MCRTCAQVIGRNSGEDTLVHWPTASSSMSIDGDTLEVLKYLGNVSGFLSSSGNFCCIYGLLVGALKAAGAGINLTAASTVFLLEPWWNPAVEEQAMDKVHRFGQTEDVKIVRMIAQNNIEERILELQEKKKQLAKQAFVRKSPKDRRKISADDLRTLMSL